MANLRREVWLVCACANLRCMCLRGRTRLVKLDNGRVVCERSLLRPYGRRWRDRDFREHGGPQISLACDPGWPLRGAAVLVDDSSEYPKGTGGPKASRQGRGQLSKSERDPRGDQDTADYIESRAGKG